GDETISITYGMSEDDIETNLRHPLMMIGSDGIPNLRGKPHPRLFGTFPRARRDTARGSRQADDIALVRAVRTGRARPPAPGVVGRPGALRSRNHHRHSHVPGPHARADGSEPGGGQRTGRPPRRPTRRGRGGPNAPVPPGSMSFDRRRLAAA